MSKSNNIKYGVFMGSFDPVHNGHEKIVRETLSFKVLGEYEIDKVIIVPAHQNPSKPQSTPFSCRVDMLNLAFKDLIESGKVIIDTIEQDLSIETKRFAIPSFETIAQLTKKYGEFKIITTTETMEEMAGWINPDFFKPLHYVVHCFGNGNGNISTELQKRYPNIDAICPKPYAMPLHSSMIRKGSNTFRKKNLNKSVYKYIKAKGLYVVEPNKHCVVDGKERWFERLCAACAIICDIDDDSAIVYVLANQRGIGCPDFNGYWNMPCGFIEKYESGEEAACRECSEEGGPELNPENFELAGVETEPGRCNNGNITIRYFALGHHGEFMKREFQKPHGEENEVSSVKWIPLNEIDNYKWAFNHYDILRRQVPDMLRKHFTDSQWDYLTKKNKYLAK